MLSIHKGQTEATRAAKKIKHSRVVQLKNQLKVGDHPNPLERHCPREKYSVALARRFTIQQVNQLHQGQDVNLAASKPQEFRSDLGHFLSSKWKTQSVRVSHRKAATNVCQRLRRYTISKAMLAHAFSRITRSPSEGLRLPHPHSNRPIRHGPDGDHISRKLEISQEATH